MRLEIGGVRHTAPPFSGHVNAEIGTPNLGDMYGYSLLCEIARRTGLDTKFDAPDPDGAPGLLPECLTAGDRCGNLQDARPSHRVPAWRQGSGYWLAAGASGSPVSPASLG